MMLPRLRWVALCLLALITATPPAGAQVLRVTADDRAPARADAFTARGYATYPLTLLTTLGAEITSTRRAVVVHLFGDTLRFLAGQAAFWTDGRAEPLHAWSFEKDDTLFVPRRFFTEWLPRRYPDRVSYADSTLRLAGSDARRGEVLEAAPAPQRSRAAVTGPAPAPATADREPLAVARDPDPFYGSLVGFIDARVAGVYDSNIDHRPTARGAYGTATRLRVGIQSARSRPFFLARYDLGYYRFPESERWNRGTHDVNAELAPGVGRVRLRLAAAVRIGSWTEDRELADQIVLRPQLEARVTNTKTLNLYVAQRARRVGSGAEARSDTSRVAGAWFYQWWRDGGFLLDGRYERTASERPASRFEGWSLYSTLKIPFAGPHRLGLKFAYDERTYPENFPGGGASPRADQRWNAALSLTRELAGGDWELGAEYDLEENSSNEPYAVYQARRVELTVRRRW